MNWFALVIVVLVLGGVGCLFWKLNAGQDAPVSCIGCGKCEKHCPQGIQIRQELKNAARELEVPAYKIGRKGVEWLKLY